MEKQCKIGKGASFDMIRMPRTNPFRKIKLDVIGNYTLTITPPLNGLSIIIKSHKKWTRKKTHKIIDGLFTFDVDEYGCTFWLANLTDEPIKIDYRECVEMKVIFNGNGEV